MAKSKKVTRALINKEITRIRNIVREAEEQGYIFNDVIPKNVNVTKSTLQRLRGISRADLLKTARRVDIDTGEIILTQAEKNIEIRNANKEAKKRVQERRNYLKQKRQNSKQVQAPQYTPQYDEYDDYYDEPYYPNFADIVLDNFENKFKGFPKEMREKLSGLINQLVNEQGKLDTAIALEGLSSNMIGALHAQGYSSDSIIEQIGLSIIANLPNASNSYIEDLSEAYEMNETGFTIED